LIAALHGSYLLDAGEERMETSPSPEGRGRVTFRSGPARAERCVAARRGSRVVLLSLTEVWAFEAKNRLSYVHSTRGRFEVDLSLTEVAATPIGAGFVRVHRNWLASYTCIREMALRKGSCCVYVGGLSDEECTLCVPVSRTLAKRVRRYLLQGAVGIRKC
jgi:DNA-binding LytR/AlgR family response regulator